jgi:hypothetical protein
VNAFGLESTEKSRQRARQEYVVVIEHVNELSVTLARARLRAEPIELKPVGLIADAASARVAPGWLVTIL